MYKLLLSLLVIVLCRQSDGRGGGGSKGRGKLTRGHQFPFPNIRLKTLIGKKIQHPDVANITWSSHWYHPYKLGYKIELLCQAAGNPMPEIIWYKDGIEMEKQSNRFVYMRIINDSTTYSKVEIDPAVVGDQGEFSCLAHNKNGGEFKNFKTEYI